MLNQGGLPACGSTASIGLPGEEPVSADVGGAGVVVALSGLAAPEPARPRLGAGLDSGATMGSNRARESRLRARVTPLRGRVAADPGA